MRLIDADVMIERIQVLQRGLFEKASNDRIKTHAIMHGVLEWCVEAISKQAEAERQDFISKSELLEILDKYKKYYGFTHAWTGDDAEDSARSTVNEIKEIVELYPCWDKWFNKEGNKE